MAHFGGHARVLHLHVSGAFRGDGSPTGVESLLRMVLYQSGLLEFNVRTQIGHFKHRSRPSTELVARPGNASCCFCSLAGSWGSSTPLASTVVMMLPSAFASCLSKPWLLWFLAQKLATSSTPQLPFKISQIPSNKDHKALNRGILRAVGSDFGFPLKVAGALENSPRMEAS